LRFVWNLMLGIWDFIDSVDTYRYSYLIKVCFVPVCPG
jgi:hypothetical protein